MYSILLSSLKIKLFQQNFWNLLVDTDAAGPLSFFY